MRNMRGIQTRISTQILLSFLLGITLFVCSFLPTSVHAKAQSYDEELSRELIIQLTNTERANAGLAKLHENPILDRIAEARAKDILQTQYPSHMSPTGQEVSHVARMFGYRYRYLAENLASGNFGSNGKLVSCWMQSAAHRKNILSTRITEIGVSVVKGKIDGTEMWVSVQVFGLQMSGTSSMYGSTDGEEGTSEAEHHVKVYVCEWRRSPDFRSILKG